MGGIRVRNGTSTSTLRAFVTNQSGAAISNTNKGINSWYPLASDFSHPDSLWLRSGYEVIVIHDTETRETRGYYPSLKPSDDKIYTIQCTFVGFHCDMEYSVRDEKTGIVTPGLGDVAEEAYGPVV